MPLFRVYFWSQRPMMLLYMKVGFIPAELLVSTDWRLSSASLHHDPLDALRLVVLEALIRAGFTSVREAT